MKNLYDAQVFLNRNFGIPSEQVALVGSTYSLGHGNDLDILVLGDMYALSNTLEGMGWTRETLFIHYDNTDFISLRKDNVNLLLTDDQEFFERFKLAAEVCKVLNLADRRARILVHRVVRDGLSSEEAHLATGY